MRAMSPMTCFVGAFALVLVASGCTKPSPNDSGAAGAAGSAEADDHDHDEGHDGHGHEDEHQGPHDGHVIELGRNHEFHAEVVENEEAGMVTVYILDKKMKELAIDQATIVMNLKFDGKGKTFELTAVDASDGKASRFDATDRSLFEALHEHEATGKIRVTINGDPYSGEVEHHHHDEHDDHDEHDEHDDH